MKPLDSTLPSFAPGGCDASHAVVGAVHALRNKLRTAGCARDEGEAAQQVSLIMYNCLREYGPAAVASATMAVDDMVAAQSNGAPLSVKQALAKIGIHDYQEPKPSPAAAPGRDATSATVARLADRGRND